MIFNNVKNIKILEGNVKSIACGGNVIWQKPSENANLISFTIEGTTYQAVDGMTWDEWVYSEYNTGGFYLYGESYEGSIIINGEEGMDQDGVLRYKRVQLDTMDINVAETIIQNCNYDFSAYVHGGGTND